MAYITAEDYRRLIGDPPEDFDALNAFATEAVDQMTLWGLIGHDLSVLPQPIQDSVQKAAAHEVQYLDGLGGLSAVNDGPLASASLGKYSFTLSGSAAGAGTSPYSPCLLYTSRCV